MNWQDEQKKVATGVTGGQEPMTWRNAAIRVGEDLCSVGPFGYYDMTVEQWLNWALGVVTVHLPQPKREWVGLTAEEREQVQSESYGKLPHHVALIAAVEAKLKEKNA